MILNFPDNLDDIPFCVCREENGKIITDTCVTADEMNARFDDLTTNNPTMTVWAIASGVTQREVNT